MGVGKSAEVSNKIKNKVLEEVMIHFGIHFFKIILEKDKLL
jgi:hypothetical protein